MVKQRADLARAEPLMAFRLAARVINLLIFSAGLISVGRLDLTDSLISVKSSCPCVEIMATMAS